MILESSKQVPHHRISHVEKFELYSKDSGTFFSGFKQNVTHLKVRSGYSVESGLEGGKEE